MERFAGLWHLSRRIEDRRAGEEGRFEGTAVLAPVPGGLDYREEGVLTMAGRPPLAGARAYRWRAAGAQVVVQFADGRPFHRFDPDTGAMDAAHQCGADLYRVCYGFEQWPDWTAVWEVRGPRKDYRLHSHYRR